MSRQDADHNPAATQRDYDLHSVIGEGSQGVVWLAEDRIGRRVAVKMLREGSDAWSRRREEEALRDYRAIEDEPHLLRVLHVGLSEDRLYYSMELADDASGPDEPYAPYTLAWLLSARGPLPATEAVGIIRDVLRGLASLHRHGLLHRDVKPSNILRAGGVWKIGDLGLVTRESSEVSVVGTIEFVPPNGPIDRSSDLYACGRLLYCMLTGQPARAFPALPASLLKNSTPLLQGLIDVINRACDPNPERRFRDSGEFVAALEHAPVESGWTRRLLIGGLLGAVATGPLLLLRGRPAARTNATPFAWRPLFDGRTLDGWSVDEPIHGEWSVASGRIRCVRSPDYKVLTYRESLGPGSIRLTFIPDHPGARMGLRYAEGQLGGGHLFMCMGDKYTWLRGSRVFFPPNEPGNWFSFPGRVPTPGEEMTMEVAWGPEGHRLYADCQLLYELPPTRAGGTMSLEVWAHDSGAFSRVEYREGGDPDASEKAT